MTAFAATHFAVGDYVEYVGPPISPAHPLARARSGRIIPRRWLVTPPTTPRRGEIAVVEAVLEMAGRTCVVVDAYPSEAWVLSHWRPVYRPTADLIAGLMRGALAADQTGEARP